MLAFLSKGSLENSREVSLTDPSHIPPRLHKDNGRQRLRLRKLLEIYMQIWLGTTEWRKHPETYLDKQYRPHPQGLQDLVSRYKPA